MPFYVCRQDCQVLKEIEVKGGKKTKAVWFRRGEVSEFPKCPPHFEELGPVDFAIASREELMASKWTFAEAKKAIKDAFDVELIKSPKDTKEELVDKIIDVRFRGV